MRCLGAVKSISRVKKGLGFFLHWHYITQLNLGCFREVCPLRRMCQAEDSPYVRRWKIVRKKTICTSVTAAEISSAMSRFNIV